VRKGNRKQNKAQVENGIDQGQRTISLFGEEIVLDARADLLTDMIRAGLIVMYKSLKDDVEMLCGPRYSHSRNREGTRWGKVPGEVTMGGRKIRIERQRVRKPNGEEIILPTYRHYSNDDPLKEHVLNQILIGVSTRNYERSLEVKLDGRSTSKSAVSRRFVLLTQRQLAEWMNRPLDDLDLLVLFIDGIEVGDHTLVVAIGVDSDGIKHVLGVWEGSTENATVCQALLSDLAERGLRTDRRLLVVLDGSKALRKAVRQTFGDNAVVQRCQEHKRRNVASYLPKDLQGLVRMRMRQAYQKNDVDKARSILEGLARQLEEDYPGAAASLRESMEETLTVIALGLPKTLRQSLQTTNIIESTLSSVRHVSRNVKRWRSGSMALRWTVTSLIEAEKSFKRLWGYRDLSKLAEALGRSKQLNAAKEVA